jgi:hypothetical protein
MFGSRNTKSTRFGWERYEAGVGTPSRYSLRRKVLSPGLCFKASSTSSRAVSSCGVSVTHPSYAPRRIGNTRQPCVATATVGWATIGSRVTASCRRSVLENNGRPLSDEGPVDAGHGGCRVACALCTPYQVQHVQRVCNESRETRPPSATTCCLARQPTPFYRGRLRSASILLSLRGWRSQERGGSSPPFRTTL